MFLAVVVTAHQAQQAQVVAVAVMRLRLLMLFQVSYYQPLQ
jgi:hypothetical protein